VILPSRLVCVKRVRGKGRGVFAAVPIREGEIIEEAPIVRFPRAAAGSVSTGGDLTRYFFAWDTQHVAIALGCGSLYNHSYEPNAHYRHLPMAMAYVALCDIAAGEEITINYNGDPQDRAQVGFQVIGSTVGRGTTPRKRPRPRASARKNSHGR
jgi:SET domain-containing protein